MKHSYFQTPYPCPVASKTVIPPAVKIERSFETKCNTLPCLIVARSHFAVFQIFIPYIIFLRNIFRMRNVHAKYRYTVTTTDVCLKSSNIENKLIKHEQLLF